MRYPFDTSVAQFCEHANFKGDRLPLRRGRGYDNLPDVDRGLFGDWNDIISSVYLPSRSTCILHEHTGWSGQTLTLSWSETYLEGRGWNDRVSSVEFW